MFVIWSSDFHIHVLVIFLILCLEIQQQQKKIIVAAFVSRTLLFFDDTADNSDLETIQARKHNYLIFLSIVKIIFLKK